ncbi:hypothetical protein AXF42_Ash016047 [Apostasia shenzhenica]|uniref:Serine/threonine-protein phosphatase 4 regulatory subunit 2 n=1 Tax=Apostasia shenzhenica TaxID=1088818 RepID=A0A2I0B393_9ASPA|nr:hypothetical protein AXF42_Ash016047 [Apostasia shenzhenica]
MENTIQENSQISELSSSDVNCHSEETVSHHSNHKDAEPKLDLNPEEIRSILEVIAATGKFWHDWEMLKKWLSFQLKQVLANYPEAKLTCGAELQQSSLSGETYIELAKKLDEALLCFVEGPPFTLQRLCEILLNPMGTYRSLSKLALALEKNLLVTSTLTMCTDPYPATPTDMPDEPEVLQESLDYQKGTPNGIGKANADDDEEMLDAESTEELTNKDTEMKEERLDDDSTSNFERNSEYNSSEEHCETSEQQISG